MNYSDTKTNAARANHELISLKQDKRKFLKWTPPVVVAVMLPTHAQATPLCAASLVVRALVPSKCAGNPPEGQAAVQILSDSIDISIESISHDASGTDTLTLPALPAPASSTDGVNLVWEGPGSDAITCLPLNTITVNVNYICGESTEEVTQNFSLTEILAAAIP